VGSAYIPYLIYDSLIDGGAYVEEVPMESNV